PLDLEVDVFRRELSTLMVEAGLRNRDFRTELGVGCQAVACDLLFPSAFYRSRIQGLKLSEKLDQKFPMMQSRRKRS
ncbi:MAG TPA: hypothetical protein VJG90_08890, partial [Candidatus Nanoarchaeia archaeon]|nr:hypothetical protein [Candidatus Nanoarchaeia archaeon]